MKLHQRILELIDGNTARMVDGEVVTVNPLTVTAGPSTTAVAAVSLLPVSVGDKVTILQQGANRLVLGRARTNPRNFAAGAFSGTTNATTSALVVTHNLSMPTPYAVTIQPISPNGSSQTNRWTGWNVTAATSDTFTIGRCISQDGSLLTDTAVTGRFIVVPY